MDIVPFIVSFGTEAKEKGLGDNSSIPGSTTGSLFDLGEGFLAKTCGLFSTSIIAPLTSFWLSSQLDFKISVLKTEN